MHKDTKRRYTTRAAIAKALAHPTRLFIVDELAQGERCVRDLTKMIGSDMSTVSKHLSLLRNAGIVRDQRRGKQVFYTLACDCVLNFFDCIEAVMAERDGTAARTTSGTACACGTR